MGRAGGLAGVFLWCVGCGPDLYLMFQDHDRVKGSDWVYTGGGCAAVGDGSSGGMGFSDAHTEMSLSVNDEGAHVIVMEGGEVTVDRVYDEEFLESGKKARIKFHLASGWERRMTFWGGPECAEPEMPDEEEIERLLERDAGAGK